MLKCYFMPLFFCYRGMVVLSVNGSDHIKSFFVSHVKEVSLPSSNNNTGFIAFLNKVTT